MTEQQSKADLRERALRTLVSFAASRMEDYESGDLEQRLAQVSKDEIDRFELKGPLTKVRDGVYSIRVHDQFGGIEREVTIEDNNLEMISKQYSEFAPEYVALAKSANGEFKQGQNYEKQEESRKKIIRRNKWKKRAANGAIMGGILGVLSLGVNRIYSCATSPEFKARTARIEEQNKRMVDEENSRRKLAKQKKEEQEEVAKKVLLIQPKDTYVHRYNLNDDLEVLIYQTPYKPGARTLNFVIERGDERFISDWYSDLSYALGDIENLDKYQRIENGGWMDIGITDSERKSYNDLIKQIAVTKEE